MKTIEYEFYEVYESYDRSSRSIAKFTSLGDAMQLAATSNYYQCSGKISKSSVVIWESFSEYKEATSEQAKRTAALAKLTDEEKKLLGLI